MTGSKSCQPWPSECNPLSPRWCALDASCKPICRRGMYYDSKENKCFQCPYGTFQPMPRRGCCRVRTCPAGMIPGPSRYNGIFPPLCVKKPETPPPPPAMECCSNGTCKSTQGESAPPHAHQQKPPYYVLHRHSQHSFLSQHCLSLLSSSLAQLFECPSLSRLAASTLLWVTTCMERRITSRATRCIMSFPAAREQWQSCRSFSWQQGTCW